VKVHAEVVTDERFRHADEAKKRCFENPRNFHHCAWRMPVEPVMIEAFANEVRWG
jgi:hypothetical protein